jgi:ribosomal protein S18 acetylase RimI-like enzyme
MIVRAEARGKGVGSELMRATIELARAEGLSRITILTGHDNAAAHRLYRKHGFEPSQMAPMRLHLDTRKTDKEIG